MKNNLNKKVFLGKLSWMPHFSCATKLSGLVLLLGVIDGYANQANPKIEMIATFSQVEAQKEGIITGKVLDERGEPLVGANVSLKGTTIGTITDAEGNFSLSADPGETILVSFIGMEPIIQKIDHQNRFTFRMKADAQMMEEVVVTAMGLEKQAKSLTYTAQTVGGNELTRAKDVNLINSLQGKSAGLVITPNSTGAGGASKILLRGNKSIQGSNQPLIVVDGVPLANTTNSQAGSIMGGQRDGGDALSTLNPDDIASVSILKGASAAALYGSVAANGAIMITTKKGREGAIRIDVSSNTSIENAMSLPKLQNKYGSDGREYSWGNKLKNQGAVDNISDFFRTGSNFNNTISLNGGSENAQTYFSYGNTTAFGITPTNDFYRHNLTGRQNLQMFDKKVSFDFVATYINQRTVNKPGSGTLLNPLTGVYLFPRERSLSDYKTFEKFDIAKSFPVQQWHINTDANDSNQNPYWILNRQKTVERRSRATFSGTAKWQIIDCLYIQGRLSYDRSQDHWTRKQHASSYKNEYGSYTDDYILSEQMYGDAFLNFHKVFGDFEVTATAGGSFLHNKANTIGVNTGNTPVTVDEHGKISGDAYFPNQFYPSNYYANIARQDYTQKRINSIFATAQVGYHGMAYLDLSARNDWSSALAYTPDMSFFYPSVGANVIVNELFKIDQTKLNLLKLRGSYSVVGNDIPAYKTLWLPSAGGAGGKPSLSVTEKKPFSTLKPEKMHSFEIGFDLAMFDNKFNMDFTFYKTNTKNQYFEIESPWSSGYRTMFVNAGDIENKGFETSINYLFDWNRQFTWSTTLNLSYNTNKIKKLCDGLEYFLLSDQNSFQVKLFEGGSYGDLYAYDVLRQENGELLLDSDGNPQLTPKPDTKVGNMNSKWHLGWSNQFNYKNWSLYFLIDGRIGGKAVSLTEAVLDGYGVSERSGAARDAGGVRVGNQTIPAETYYKSTGATAWNTAFAGTNYVYNATNFRLRELSVGYLFRDVFGPSKNINVSLVGRNLFFLYKDAPFDPDVSMGIGNGVQSIACFNLPTVRSFGLNLKLTF